jgi:tRNA (adenine37-N6)-methyltransferase
VNHGTNTKRVKDRSIVVNKPLIAGTHEFFVCSGGGMSRSIPIVAVGYVRAARTRPEDDGWDAVESQIDLDTEQFGPEALAGLGEFSHVEVLFHFHAVPEREIETKARHPRGNTAWPKAGIFAQRGKNRPNRIGATICELLSVDGTTLRLRGIDAIDGTPVIDIKPVMMGFLPRAPLREPAWATELMRDYW